MFHVILAGILSLIFPGIGQIYNNQWWKGLPLAFVELVFIYFFSFDVWATILYRVIWLYAVIDAIVFAIKIRKSRGEKTRLRGYKAVLGVGLSLLIVLLLALLPQYLPAIMQSYAGTSQEIPDEVLNDVQKRAEQYLEEKYEQPFSVEGADYSEDTGGYLMLGHPEGSPEVEFGIFVDEEGEFSDSYPEDLWTMEAKNQLEPFVKKLYDDIAKLKIDVRIDERIRETIPTENGEVPDYEDIRKQYPDDYFQVFQLDVIQDVTEGTKQEEVKKIHEIVSFLQDHHLDEVSLTIEYYDEALLEEKGHDIEPGLDDMGYNSYTFSISAGELEKIDSREDVDKLLQENNF